MLVHAELFVVVLVCFVCIYVCLVCVFFSFFGCAHIDFGRILYLTRLAKQNHRSDFFLFSLVCSLHFGFNFLQYFFCYFFFSHLFLQNNIAHTIHLFYSVTSLFSIRIIIISSCNWSMQL